MKMIFIFLITIIILLADSTICHAQMQITGGNRNRSNLEISQPTIINISVCPGCQKTFETESYCMEWTVTTNQSQQDFQVFFCNPSNASSLNLDWVWTFQDDLSGEWKEFNNCKTPTGAYGHTGNIFRVESSESDCRDIASEIKFRVCVTGLQAPSTQSKCNLDCGFNVTVTCTSGCDEEDDRDHRGDR